MVKIINGREEVEESTRKVGGVILRLVNYGIESYEVNFYFCWVFLYEIRGMLADDFNNRKTNITCDVKDFN